MTSTSRQALASPSIWRCLKEQATLGMLADMGFHAFSMIEVPMGQRDALIVEVQTIYPTRPHPDCGDGTVENEDVASAVVRFPSGGQVAPSTSGAACGCKNRIEWEPHGTHGQLSFDQDGLNELQRFRSGEGFPQGFLTILMGSDHPPFSDFKPGVSDQSGFDDFKIV